MIDRLEINDVGVPKYPDLCNCTMEALEEVRPMERDNEQEWNWKLL